MRDRRSFIVLLIGLALGGATFILLQGGRGPRDAPPDRGGPGPRPAASRALVLSPALVEIVFAIGAQDRVVGVSDFCTYPPEVAELPSCGGIINPNYEAMESLRPDLVVVQGLSDTIVEYCEAAGIPTLEVPLDSLDDVLAAVVTLGQALGAEESANRLAGEMQAELDKVSAAVQGRPRPRVFVSTGRSLGRLKDMMSAGKGSFLDDLISLAGGENIFGDVESLWPSPALEAVVAAGPEVIIDILPDQQLDAQAVEEAVRLWNALGDSVPAVRNGRVYVVSDASVLIPGPRVTQTARTLARLLHPEVVTDE